MDDEHLYWINEDGSVMKGRRDGTGDAICLANVGALGGIAPSLVVSSTHLYVGTYDPWIKRIPK